MKAIMMSIQPKWCELIASGKKTVEIRKTKPKLETPFKVYIYCTKPKIFFKISSAMYSSEEYLHLCDGKVSMGDGFDLYNKEYKTLNGKVIGEFVCDDITYLGNIATDPWKYLSGSTHEYHKKLVIEKGCLTENEILYYGGQYAWHISDLVIYDKPKEFYNFCRPCDKNCDKCNYLEVQEIGNFEHTKVFKTCLNRITRPPQSWCYVEELV